MARDYKDRDRRRGYADRRRRKGPPPWAWVTVGLLVGLFVAFLVFLQLRPAPPVERTVKLETPPEPATRPAAEDPVPEPAPATSREEPPAAPAKPRFEFYNLLPEMGVIVPEQEVKGEASPEGVRQVEQPGTYLLQAGSFRTREQADQLRARLALLGVETDVQTVTVNNQQTWHRVRVGPYRNLRDLNAARSLLKKNGIDAILIRLAG